MKTLFLLRHGKSRWDEDFVQDYERALKKRGARNATEMGKRIALRADKPELIIASFAERTLRTAQLVAAELDFKSDEIVVDKAIYAAECDDLQNIIKQFDDAYERILLVGHNPTLTEALNHFTNAGIENVPTCGLGVVQFSTGSWSSVNSNNAQLLHFDYPKKQDN